MTAPTLAIEAIDLYERDVTLRMPFRFGVVTLRHAPQAYARARIRVSTDAAGRRAEGMAAELMAPKWFDKDPALSNEDNFDQLRCALASPAATISMTGRRRRSAISRATIAARSTTAPPPGWFRWSPTTDPP